ncbi:PH domain-containing protein [Lentzea sp. NPDC042327]|uniref:PH domain-containing protein n=1 Tax=Lentzea sp. NPDC042327 TaxID=3154801 RepID=UPI0033FA3372
MKARAVLRRRSDSAVGWSLAIGGTGGTAYVLLHPLPGAGFAQQTELVAVMAPLIWFCWMVFAHPAVRVHESGVRVVNWFRSYWVPWTALREVEVTREVVLVLTTGERVDVTAGAFSLASALGGSRVQHRMREEIERHRPAVPPAGEVPGRRLDLCPWHFLGLVALLLVVAWAGVS